MQNSEVLKLDTELEQSYCNRMYSLKDELGLTWNDLANIINTQLNWNYSPDKYRKEAYKYISNKQADLNLNAITFEDIICERKKLSDERAQINALYRRIAREDTLKEIAHDVALIIDNNFKLPLPKNKKVKNSDKEAILQISDWHYGIEIENYWNSYNPQIAAQRIAQLQDAVIARCDENNIKTLHVVNLGDLIAGRIHLPLRLNSRIDVITQIIEVSELLAQMLNNLSMHYNIEYYDTLDNHSRLEPNLKEAIDLESLARITTWYLKTRLHGSINIYNNTFSDDIITFNILGHNVAAVHGNKDKPTKVVDNMSLMTQQHYDLILTAHLHHFSADEKNETLVISNSSMMGTDDFAEKLRLSAKPAQNLIIVTKNSVMETLYRICLD